MPSTNHFDFLDALKGFAMLSVIYYHLLIYDAWCDSAINNFITRWHMPLFFFISGFLSVFRSYDMDKYKKGVANRLTKQVYPTFVIWFLFIIFTWLISGGSVKDYLLHGIYDPAKRGYWFTITLVEIYCLYMALSYSMFKNRLSLIIQSFVYLGIGIIGALFYLLIYSEWEPQGRALQFDSVLSLSKLIWLSPFFFLGLFCRINQDRFFKTAKSPRFMSGLAALLVLSILFDYTGSSKSALYFISSILNVILLFSVFLYFESFFSGKSRIGTYLIRIGRNSFPIYLFHFFIIFAIPSLLPNYKSYLMVNSPMELVIVTALSAIVTEICIFAYTSLRKASHFHNFLFNPLSFRK